MNGLGATIRLADEDAFSGFGASPDGLGASIRLGADDEPTKSVAFTQNPAKRALVTAYAIAGVAGAALGAYHGYKRNDSVGWAICWSLLGSIAPVIVIPVAFAQGLGKPTVGGSYRKAWRKSKR